MAIISILCFQKYHGLEEPIPGFQKKAEKERKSHNRGVCDMR